MTMETKNNKAKLSIAVALSALLVLGLSACAPAKLDVSNVTAIIDTRSPSEFAKGHIVGAVNVEYVQYVFVASVTGLNRQGVYYVYGKNSEDAGKAATDMQSLGIQNVTNLGNYEDAQHVLPLGVTK